MHNSGKLLIITMFLAALLAAAASWWFRYEATHRSAKFWGPEAARLIRDAPLVELLHLRSTAPPRMILRSADPRQDQSPLASSAPDGSSPRDELQLGQVTWIIEARRDIFNAPGLTHLRNALLEDRSFGWGTYLTDLDDPPATTALVFRESADSHPLTILFLPNFTRALVSGPGDDRFRSISTQPIAAGLAETINDWSQQPAAP
jgi:hypothetical protein